MVRKRDVLFSLFFPLNSCVDSVHTRSPTKALGKRETVRRFKDSFLNGVSGESTRIRGRIESGAHWSLCTST